MLEQRDVLNTAKTIQILEVTKVMILTRLLDLRFLDGGKRNYGIRGICASRK